MRANVFHFNRGHERDYDYYLDIGEYSPGADAWQSADLYLDIEVRTGTSAVLTDIDELLEAARHGLVTPEAAELAVRRAVAAVEGLAHNGYDLGRWLAGHGINLTWRG